MQKKKFDLLFFAIITFFYCSISIYVLFNLNKNVLLNQKDFVAYVTAATIIKERGFTSLYDLAFQKEIQKKLEIGGGLETSLLSYRNPPLLAFIMIPLAFLTPQTGFKIAVIFNLACLILSLLVLKKLGYIQGNWETTLALTYIPVAATLANGQITIFLALVFLMSIYTSKQCSFKAGVLGSLLLLKPQLIIMPILLGVISQKKPSYFKGLTAGTFLFIAVNTALLPSFIIDYPKYLMKTEAYSYGTKLNENFNLMSVSYLTNGLNYHKELYYILAFVSLTILTIYFCLLFRTTYGSELSYNRALASILLLSPSINIHSMASDLTLVIVSICILINYSRVRIVGYLVYILPILGFVGLAFASAICHLILSFYLLTSKETT